ncbi:MAG: DUF1622 domain-containing protein [Hydrococcus sp. CRU_1_1]|nr:DUF1622 domain-containing protein [Hydrococcus sp. CRU_1_1]
MHSSNIISTIEHSLFELALCLKLSIEGIAIFIIAFSILRTIPKIIYSHKKPRSEDFYISIRLDLGLSLALSLEFLLAADIIGTAISPGWEAIGVLAATAGIRTFLNYFLQKEVKRIRTRKIGKTKTIFI